MLQGVRDLAVWSKVKNTKGVHVDRIDIDEDLLNIYDFDLEPIPHWEPSVKLPLYDEVSKVFFDIETHSDDADDPKSSLKPEKSRITLIGLMNERGRTHIINCEDMGERQGILEFFNIIAKKKPTFLTGFNIFKFDLPFIIKRCEILGISHPFTVSEKETVIENAKEFGTSVRYQNIWLDWAKTTAIVDLYHQALLWDNVQRKLTRFGLKYVPLQMKLIEEVPKELSYPEIRQAIADWEAGGRDELIKYLESDLILTQKLGNYLIPDIYYQKQLLPHWNYQSLGTGGMGTKWNDILMTAYQSLIHRQALRVKPSSDTTTDFKGGLVGSRAGLYRNVSKIDVASLYPSIMLLYGIHSYKDVKRLILAILKNIYTERLRLKAIAETKKGTEEGRIAKQRQGALKILINSAYGFLGTKNKEFNDYVAAALVTAYGRAILKRMIELCIEAGGVHANWDTDGLYYATNDPDFKENDRIYNYIQKHLPEGINIEHEVQAAGFYVPPASDKDAEDGEGLRKNYIIVFRNGEVKANGKYRKRDKCGLEKDFIPNVVKAYIEKPENAKKYYQQVLTQLMTRSYDTEKLSITRKIKVGEKRLVELGIGQEQDVVTYYKAPDKPIIGKRGQVLKKVEVMHSTSTADIDWLYYINMVQEMWAEFESMPKY